MTDLQVAILGGLLIILAIIADRYLNRPRKPEARSNVWSNANER